MASIYALLLGGDDATKRGNLIWLDVFSIAPMDIVDYLIPYMRPPDIPNVRGIGRADAGLPTLSGTTWPPNEEIATILARPDYLGIDREIIRRSLFAGNDSLHNEEFHLFNRFGVNEPTAEKASWVVSHMRSAGLMEDFPSSERPNLDAIFRRDIYAEATAGSTA